MNNRIAILGGIALITAAYAAQDGIVLKRTLIPNTTDTYNVEVKTNSMTPMGEASMITSMKVAYKVGALDAATGKADLEMTTTDMKMEVGGLMQMAAAALPTPPKSVTTKGKIDAQGRITEMKAPATGGAGMQMLAGASNASFLQSIAFPDKPLRIGDTWDVPIPKNPLMGNADTKLVGKLTGEQDFNGTPAYVITVTGTLPLKTNTAAMAKADPEAAKRMPPMGNMTMNGNAEITATTLVEKATGRTLKTDGTVKSKSNVSGEQLPMPLEIDSVTTLKMVLAK